MPTLPPFPQNVVVNPKASLPMSPQWIAWFNALQRDVNGSPFVTVQQFGAKGDGVTDDGNAFQSAMNAVSTAGGGIVYVPSSKYFFGTGTALTLPSRVTLKGVPDGPFDGNASVVPSAPTMLVTNTITPFITSTTSSSKVENLLFYYPNQVAPTATTPTTYPATVYFNGGTGTTGNGVVGCTFINSFIAINILGSQRMRIENCIIGAFNRGIILDDVVDWVIIDKIMFQVMWDFYANLAYPQNIDNYVLSNCINIQTLRADSVQVSNVGVFSTYIFHNADDSPLGISPKNSYGRMVNIDIDTCAYGVVAKSTNTPGFDYSNICFGANNGGHGTAGQWAAITQAGGTGAPRLSFVGGTYRGTWAGGSPPFNSAAAGTIVTTAIAGV